MADTWLRKGRRVIVWAYSDGSVFEAGTIARVYRWIEWVEVDLDNGYRPAITEGMIHPLRAPRSWVEPKEPV